MNQVTSFLKWWPAIPVALFLSLFALTGTSYADDHHHNNEVKVCYAPTNVLDPYEEKEFDNDADANTWLADPEHNGEKRECSHDEKEGDEVCHIPSDDNEPAETIKVRHGKTADWITVYSADTVGECADDLKEEKICHFPNGTSQPAENRKIRKNAWASWSAEHSDDQKRECTDNELTGTSSWESVSSSTTVDANCVALTTVVTSETELITYEKEMKKSAESKRKDYEDKRKDEESLVISDPDNADEHQANKDKYDDLEKEYKKSKDEHEDREKEHKAKKKKFLNDDNEGSTATTATQVPTGSSACTTPDGTAGFLPPTPSDAANGSASSPTKKALREIFGQ